MHSTHTQTSFSLFHTHTHTHRYAPLFKLHTEDIWCATAGTNTKKNKNFRGGKILYLSGITVYLASLSIVYSLYRCSDYTLIVCRAQVYVYSNIGTHKHTHTCTWQHMWNSILQTPESMLSHNLLCNILLINKWLCLLAVSSLDIVASEISLIALHLTHTLILYNVFLSTLEGLYIIYNHTHKNT